MEVLNGIPTIISVAIIILYLIHPTLKASQNIIEIMFFILFTLLCVVDFYLSYQKKYRVSAYGMAGIYIIILIFFLLHRHVI